MPKLGQTNDQMDTHSIGGTTFQFSAAKIGTLGASEYTLATIVVDGSGSVDPFWNEIKAALKENVAACADPKNPRADNLMLRVLVFDSQLTEVHGFKPVRDINPADYDSLPIPGGYDGTLRCNLQRCPGVRSVCQGTRGPAVHLQRGHFRHHGRNGQCFQGFPEDGCRCLEGHQVQ